MTTAATSETRLVKTSGILAFACLAQLLSIYPLWSHISDSTAILGRYSNRYVLILGLNIALIFIWPILYIFHQQIQRWLTERSSKLRYFALLLAMIVAFISWMLPVESQFPQYISLNILFFSFIVIQSLIDRPLNHRWLWVFIGVLVFTLLAMFLTSLLDQKFSPDEAHWADYASSYFQAGGVYSRTWLQEPTLIQPGLGWSVAAYGWTLEHIGFQLTTGRIWNFIFNILAVLGVMAVTWRLYGRTAGFISAAFALFSQIFIPVYDYRPDYQLSACSMLVMFAALQGRYSTQTIRQIAWNFVCGLSATLALELHAAGIIFAAAFSLFYLAEYAITTIRNRRLIQPYHLVAFGLGGLLGVIIFYLANIQPVGGFQVFISSLFEARWNGQRRLLFLTWPSFLEGIIIIAGLAFVVWRRTSPDRVYLAVLFCVITSILIFDTQGYFSPFRALYIIPIGALIAQGIFSSNTNQTLLATITLISILAFTMLGTFINWAGIQQIIKTQSIPPNRYEAIRSQLQPLLNDEDIVVSSHLLIWTLPHQPHLVSYAGELTGMKRWGLNDPIAVWERVQPTVIVWLENEMEHNPGLDSYMQQHNFIICHTINASDLTLNIYRQNCAAES